MFEATAVLCLLATSQLSEAHLGRFVQVLVMQRSRSLFSRWETFSAIGSDSWDRGNISPWSSLVNSTMKTTRQLRVGDTVRVSSEGSVHRNKIGVVESFADSRHSARVRWADESAGAPHVSGLALVPALSPPPKNAAPKKVPRRTKPGAPRCSHSSRPMSTRWWSSCARCTHLLWRTRDVKRAESRSEKGHVALR